MLYICFVMIWYEQFEWFHFSLEGSQLCLAIFSTELWLHKSIKRSNSMLDDIKTFNNYDEPSFEQLCFCFACPFCPVWVNWGETWPGNSLVCATTCDSRDKFFWGIEIWWHSLLQKCIWPIVWKIIIVGSACVILPRKHVLVSCVLENITMSGECTSENKHQQR